MPKRKIHIYGFQDRKVPLKVMRMEDAPKALLVILDLDGSPFYWFVIPKALANDIARETNMEKVGELETDGPWPTGARPAVPE